MADKKIKKVVLAYSGGLDTSIIIPWLKENYDNCEVIAVSGNVGQASELDGLEEKAIATGASKLYIEDLNKEFVEEYIGYYNSKIEELKVLYGVECSEIEENWVRNGDYYYVKYLYNDEFTVRIYFYNSVRFASCDVDLYYFSESIDDLNNYEKQKSM